MPIEAFERVDLDGTGIDRITEAEVVAVVRDALAHGRGGRIVTPNIDILRRAQTDTEAREHLDDADLIVADGMPLVWASRLGGNPLPERVAGSSLIWSLSAGLGLDRRSIFVIGGDPPGDGAVRAARGVAPAGDGAMRAGDGAARAADRLAASCPGLRVAGTLCPDFGFERDPATYEQFCAKVIDAAPDLVFVGLGFPKQERMIAKLRPALPATWFIGCGAAVNFVAGDTARAPRWMQRTGLEWAHRLGSEPRRLAGRYLRRDAPYALKLLAQAPAQRVRSR
ncbi:WecB/TagA/CpsF family glycosyltransferase [Actinoplanes sp. KI2]|uniref:WecB/TagA/CpsF family glycosyltransferase n=1 Tax=Actinoplanes sp. KI2 TaxID=2983315 RepID=UPI0021D58F6D|nr:WecB/TagA/CpsF family glycosyltransferase [Actinoplanes sp. KI2]MCU7730250.1 WecB/TagA/CpsF family glycosyltransferase [Actinoplanes sp. KI2]